MFQFHFQADVVGALLLNASLLPAPTTDYSDRLVQVTDLTDNDGSLLSLDDCVIEQLIICSFSAEKRSISECLCSLMALLVCVIFSCVKIFNNALIFNRD